MAWHLEVLAKRQQRVLRKIGPVLTQRGFYLAGRTAVALHLGHRRSVDFDWFTQTGLDDPLQLAEELKNDGIAFVTDQVAQGTLHGSVSGVRVSLLRYRYPLLAATRTLNRETNIAARPDLAAMKLSAVAQRGAKKDFVDIYALGKRSYPLARMLQCYRDKYSVEDLGHLLYSLAYFEDADQDRLQRMFWEVDWRRIKETIRDWVREASVANG